MNFDMDIERNFEGSIGIDLADLGCFVRCDKAAMQIYKMIFDDKLPDCVYGVEAGALLCLSMVRTWSRARGIDMTDKGWLALHSSISRQLFVETCKRGIQRAQMIDADEDAIMQRVKIAYGFLMHNGAALPELDVYVFLYRIAANYALCNGHELQGAAKDKISDNILQLIRQMAEAHKGEADGLDI